MTKHLIKMTKIFTFFVDLKILNILEQNEKISKTLYEIKLARIQFITGIASLGKIWSNQ